MRSLPPLLAITIGALVVVTCYTMATGRQAGAAATTAPVYGYEVVAEYPHDPTAFTQGLIFHEAHFYESTGHTGQSTLRKVRLGTGEVVRQRAVDPRAFAEGLTRWQGRLLQLTPIRTPPEGLPDSFAKLGAFSVDFLRRRFRLNIASSYALESFEPGPAFSYKGEGWGLTSDGRRLIMSDGTARLRFLDPDTFAESGRVEVTDGGRRVDWLNELEWIDGVVYANVWRDDRVAMIDPGSGRVRGWVDLAGLSPLPASGPRGPEASVLNGIAYDANAHRLFVTGKRWPRVFEIRVRWAR